MRSIKCDRCGGDTDKDYSSISDVSLPVEDGCKPMTISGLIVNTAAGEMADLCVGCAAIAASAFGRELVKRPG